jgi:hypothetical protein
MAFVQHRCIDLFDGVDDESGNVVLGQSFAHVRGKGTGDYEQRAMTTNQEVFDPRHRVRSTRHLWMRRDCGRIR